MAVAPDILRGKLLQLLALPEKAAPAQSQVVDGAVRLNNWPVTFLCPEGTGPFPAVLYCHAHGGEYALGRHELTEGARWVSAPFASDLLDQGFAILAIDMPGFGARTGEGTETALAKASLWRGQPLFGRMIGELRGALAWLMARDEIDATRVATLGVSMGAAHAIWLAALEPRVAACAHICMLADIAPLINLGVHDRHGDYLTVPGLLNVAEFGDVAGMIAPRPQLAAFGAVDHLTPTAARDSALGRLKGAYHSAVTLDIMIDDSAGHQETPAMRRKVLEFLSLALRDNEDEGKT